MLNFFRFLLLMCLVVWMGMLIFFTFFVAPSIFKVLPRELTYDLVADLFPKFWMIGYVAGTLSLLSLIGMSIIEKTFPGLRIALLAAMTALTFYSGLVTGEKASRKMLEVRAMQDPIRKEELRQDFKKIHFQAAAMNMAVMASGVAVIFLTSRKMRL